MSRRQKKGKQTAGHASRQEKNIKEEYIQRATFREIQAEGKREAGKLDRQTGGYVKGRRKAGTRYRKQDRGK